VLHLEWESSDPHGTQFADALPKLKGLAKYAEDSAGAYHRIEAIAQVDGVLRVLDLTEKAVRDAIDNADSALALYQSSNASDL